MKSTQELGLLRHIHEYSRYILRLGGRVWGVTLLLLLVLMLLLLNLCKQHSVCLIVIAVFATTQRPHGKQPLPLRPCFPFGQEWLEWKRNCSTSVCAKEHEIFMMGDG